MVHCSLVVTLHITSLPVTEIARRRHHTARDQPDSEVEYLDFSNGEPIPKKRRGNSSVPTTAAAAAAARGAAPDLLSFSSPAATSGEGGGHTSSALSSCPTRKAPSPFVDYIQPLNQLATQEGWCVSAYTPESLVPAKFSLAKKLAEPEGFKAVVASHDPLVQLLHPIVTTWDIDPQDSETQGYTTATIKAKCGKELKTYVKFLRAIPVCLDSLGSFSEFVSEIEDRLHELIEAQPAENLANLPPGYLKFKKTALKTLRKIIESKWMSGHGGLRAQSTALWGVLSVYAMKAFYLYCCSGYDKFFLEWMPTLWDHAADLLHKPICTRCFSFGHYAETCYRQQENGGSQQRHSNGHNKFGGGAGGKRFNNNHKRGGRGNNRRDFPSGPTQQQGAGSGPYFQNKQQRYPPNHQQQQGNPKTQGPYQKQPQHQQQAPQQQTQNPNTQASH